MDLFKEVMIWKRTGETSAVRYSCLQDMLTGKYAIQSADFFRLPIEGEQFRIFERQFVELLLDVSPRDRCMWFESPEEAITAHDHDFSVDTKNKPIQA
ncbi:hypothetical protein [Chitinimonas lacunae]|uniref:Uncharacterized protein n=1 Tax=Chitinimonas lacunae TaxID=1963018 RepID=A0ABV8MPM5_9NEIS